jgi:hypothetical protein
MMLHVIGAGIGAALLQSTPPSSSEMTADQKFELARLALQSPSHNSPLQGALALLVPFAFFATITLIIWLFLLYRRSRMQARADLQRHLLDKFASGREFAEFLDSEASQRFLDEMGSRGPKEQILSSMRNGVVLAVLGLGLLGLALAKRGFLVPGVIVLALGAGFLVATAVSYKLSKQWEQQQEVKHGATS